MWTLADWAAGWSVAAGGMVVVSTTLLAAAVATLLNYGGRISAGRALLTVLVAEGIRVVSAIAGLVTLLMWPEAQLRPGWVVTGYALGLMSIWLVALKKN